MPLAEPRILRHAPHNLRNIMTKNLPHCINGFHLFHIVKLPSYNTSANNTSSKDLRGKAELR